MAFLNTKKRLHLPCRCSETQRTAFTLHRPGEGWLAVAVCVCDSSCAQHGDPIAPRSARACVQKLTNQAEAHTNATSEHFELRGRLVIYSKATWTYRPPIWAVSMRCPGQLQSRAALYTLLLCALATFAGGAFYLLATSSTVSPDSALPRCWPLPASRDTDCFKVSLDSLRPSWGGSKGALHAMLHHVLGSTAADPGYPLQSQKIPRVQ